MNKTDNGSVTAYPLAWPVGWERTRSPKQSRYGDRSLAQARNELMREVTLLGGRQLIISSNVELKQDGMPKSGRRQPTDKGVAIYFQRKGISLAIACDKWTSVEDNIWAIYLTVQAMRQIERSGASELLDRAFRGFDALPAPAESQWWNVLGVSQGASLDEIKRAYRDLVKVHHPDVGGDRDTFERVQRAYEDAMRGQNGRI